MFFKRTLELDRPTAVPTVVAKKLVELMQKLPHTSDHWVKLKAVLRPHEGKADVFDVRVYDEWESDEKKVKIEDWATLDQHPDLIQYEGWFDNRSKKVEITARRTT